MTAGCLKSYGKYHLISQLIMFNLLTKNKTHFGCRPLIIREMKTIRIQLKLDRINVVNSFSLYP